MAYLCTRCELDEIPWTDDRGRATSDQRAIVDYCYNCYSNTDHVPATPPDE